MAGSSPAMTAWGTEADGMSKRDYYEVLGVSRTCTEAELKAAFRKLAMQHHPDRNPGDKECEHKFKELNEAYDVLKDGDKRAAYDRFGHAAFEQGGMGGAHGFGADFASTFSDIFEDLFGMGGGRRRRSRTAAVCCRPWRRCRSRPRTSPRSECAVARSCPRRRLRA